MEVLARSFHSPRRVVAAAAAAAGGVTLLVTVLPWFSFAYRSDAAHVAIETAATLIALLAALLAFGRFIRSSQRSDLILAGALLLLGGTNLVFSMLPALTDGRAGVFEIWASLVGRTAASVALATAAFIPDRMIRRPRRGIARMTLAVTVALAVIAVAVLALSPVLPEGIDAELSPESSGRPRIIGSPLLLGTYLALVVLYALAAIGFTRRAERADDELMVWIAAGMAIAAFSRVNYFLFPSIYSEWVYTGDLLRLAFYLVLLTGAFREIAAYQAQLATAAAYDERRRVARDLHDGLAQDIAFIAMQSHRLDGEPRPEVAALIRQAANRALDESRRAISALTGPLEEPLGESLVRTVGELGERAGARVRFQLDRDATASPQVGEALVRIAGEAVNNSIRHGAAGNITVTLRGGDGGLRLVVRDDGTGFDEDPWAASGFGLTSMRERAEAIGGRLRLESPPEGGASVEVRIP